MMKFKITKKDHHFCVRVFYKGRRLLQGNGLDSMFPKLSWFDIKVIADRHGIELDHKGPDARLLYYSDVQDYERRLNAFLNECRHVHSKNPTSGYDVPEEF